MLCFIITISIRSSFKLTHYTGTWVHWRGKVWLIRISRQSIPITWSILPSFTLSMLPTSPHPHSAPRLCSQRYSMKWNSYYYYSLYILNLLIIFDSCSVDLHALPYDFYFNVWDQCIPSHTQASRVLEATTRLVPGLIEAVFLLAKTKFLGGGNDKSHI